MDNLLPFLINFAVFVAVVLLVLCCLCFSKKNRLKAKKLLRKLYIKTFWSGVIRSLNITYLKSFAGFALATSLVKWSSKK